MPLDGSEDFVILACDGLWDHVSPRQAAEVVYKDILCTNGKFCFLFFIACSLMMMIWR